MFKTLHNAWRAVPRAGRRLAAAVLMALVPLSPALAQGSAAATESVAQHSGSGTIAPAAPPFVDNPYGLGALWEQGDLVSKTTLTILLLMSVGSWYVLITRLRSSLRLDSDARQAREVFASASTLPQAASSLRDGSAFRFIAEAGLQARERQAGALTARIDRDTWLTMSVQRSVEQVQSRLQEGLAVLATVGSTAPFIGLFGTVWGIYHALTAIGIAGQASIDKVAGPVGEALIMTAIGLAVAVPAVLGYNWLVRRNKVTMDAVRGFSADVHAILAAGHSAG
jgi:biopolymer transport protein ExbB